MMRRLLACLSALAGVGAVAPVATGSPRPVHLAAFACHSTLDPTARTVSVTSVMRPIPGTWTLSVRFSLLERAPGTSVEQSVGQSGDLGRWLTPADPTLGRRADDVWKLAKPVRDVAAPAAYRFAVSFRWKGRDGKVLATASRRTASCRERELRPDVLVRRVIVDSVAGHRNRARYVAVVANRGRTASGPFSVTFMPGTGAPAKTKTLASLGSGGRVRVPFSGPACDPARPPTVTADAAGQVDDYDRSNNTLTVACAVAAGD